MGYIQKILLLIFTIGISMFLAIMLTYFIFFENEPFSNVILVTYFISGVGVCSFWFHLKTLKFYKLRTINAPLPEVSKIFWILDMSFAIIFLILSFFAVRSMVRFSSNAQIQQDPTQLIITVIVTIAPIWIIADVVYLNNQVRKKRNLNKFPEIDDIQGAEDERMSI